MEIHAEAQDLNRSEAIRKLINEAWTSTYLLTHKTVMLIKHIKIQFSVAAIFDNAQKKNPCTFCIQ